MNTKDKRNLFLGVVTIVVLAVITFFVMSNRADATYTPVEETPQECVEVNAPDPIEYKKGVIQYKWFESPEGTWTEKFDLDPRGGHEFWVKTGKKIVEVDCPEPEVPEDKPTPPSPYSDGRSSSPSGPPAHKVCTIMLETPTVWYGNGALNWATDQKDIEKFSLIYGQTPDSLVYGIDNIPSDSRGIEVPNGTETWNEVWWQVWTWVNGCASKSEIIDP